MKAVLLGLLTFGLMPAWAGDDFRSLTSADVSELTAQAAKSLQRCRSQLIEMTDADVKNKTSESVDKAALVESLRAALVKGDPPHASTGLKGTATLSSSSKTDKNQYQITYDLKVEAHTGGTKCVAQAGITKQSFYVKDLR